MVELRLVTTPDQKEAQYGSIFSGDVDNFSVYLKRLCTASSVRFLSSTEMQDHRSS